MAKTTQAGILSRVFATVRSLVKPAVILFLTVAGGVDATFYFRRQGVAKIIPLIKDSELGYARDPKKVTWRDSVIRFHAETPDQFHGAIIPLVTLDRVDGMDYFTYYINAKEQDDFPKGFFEFDAITALCVIGGIKYWQEAEGSGDC